MNEIEVIKKLLADKNMSYALLAEKVGFSTPSGVANRLAGRSMTVEVLIQLLEAMDCELIIRNKVGDKENYTVANENRRGNERKGKYYPRKGGDE